MTHIPVLKKEVLQYLSPKANENFVDCTAGEGGHTAAILEMTGPAGKALCIDADNLQIERCKEALKGFEGRAVFANNSYANLVHIIDKDNFGKVDGILADLGMSSQQIKESGRGFTFLKDEPLDMRYSLQNDLTAEIIVNQWRKDELERIFEEYGEEKFSRKIAQKITEERNIKPIKSTFQLVEAVKRAVPAKYQHGRIHCATRVFQALRIAVNGELESLQKFLPQAISILSSGGRIAVISFHSLEDRIVKNFFAELAKLKAVKILTKKPVMAGEQETSLNPASRTAKLRAAEKI